MPGSPATTPAPDPPPGLRVALVVATNTYTDPGLRQLRAPVQDAADLAQVLADPGIGGFAVTTVIDQPAHQVRLAVEDFLAGRGTGDLLLVYLSCHGKLDNYRRLYFAAADTRLDRLGSTGVESAWVLDQLEHCRARRQVLILDCCFSGAFAQGAKGEADLGLQDRFLGQGRGRVVLTASTATEYSFEGEPTDAASRAGSVFTAALVQGLRTGAADTRPRRARLGRRRLRLRLRPGPGRRRGPDPATVAVRGRRTNPAGPQPRRTGHHPARLCPNRCGPAWTAPTRASASAR